ncbi:hypothetical protein Hanom_Chr16g01505161 [Helianthus anomalus]
MDGVNESDENGKILNLLVPDAKKQTFGRKSQSSQTQGRKMSFYSIFLNPAQPLILLAGSTTGPAHKWMAQMKAVQEYSTGLVM